MPEVKMSSTIESTISRQNAAWGTIGSFLFVVMVIVTPMNPVIKVLCSGFFLVFFILFGSALLFSNRFKRGITLVDGGFIHCTPIGGKKTIMFADILKVEAVCRGDGGLGDDVPFLVTTDRVRVLLSETDLYRTGIIDQFFALPDFRREQYSEAANYDGSILDSFVGKKFLLYERA